MSMIDFADASFWTQKFREALSSLPEAGSETSKQRLQSHREISEAWDRSMEMRFKIKYGRR